MPTSKYLLIATDGTFCPQCKGEVVALCYGRAVPRYPSFYICWDCKWIAQVGVGPVRNSEEITERKGA